MKKELKFQDVISRLQAWRNETVDKLKSSERDEGALQLKIQLDSAIHCLEFCEKHQIHPAAKVLILPDTRTPTPSSNYRILEDHEVDDRRCWTELEIDGKSMHLCPGDKILT